MQGSSQAYEPKHRADESVSIEFKRFILEETKAIAQTPEADLYRVQLLSQMLERFDQYMANGADAGSACKYIKMEFSDIAERLRRDVVEAEKPMQERASAWPLLSEDEAALYIRQSCAAARKRALGISLCSACVMPLMLITGMNTLASGYVGDVGNLLGLCGMFGMIAMGVYAIVTVKNVENEKMIRKRRFELAAHLKKKLTDLIKAAEEKARIKRGKSIALLVASVVPIFLGAVVDELWVNWTNDAFAMMGTGVMFAMIGAGVHGLVSATAEKNAVAALLKE